jgi:hypothetical protein
MDMNIKSKAAGLIIATSLFAVAGVSHAYCVHNSSCTITPGFTGEGWHTVPCNAPYQHAVTWAQYTSGGYLAPIPRSGFLFR